MPQMPDTRIALSGIGGGIGGGGQQSPGPFGTLASMMQIKEMQSKMQQQRLEEEKRRQDEEDDDAVRTTLQQHDRPDEAIQDLYHQGRMNAAIKLGTAVSNQRRTQAQAYGEDLLSTGRALEQATQILGGVTDDASLKTATPAIGALLEPKFGKGIYDIIGTKYDKAHIDALKAWGTKRTDQIQAEHNATQDLIELYKAGGVSNPSMVGPGGEAAAVPLPAGMQAGPKWGEKATETFNKMASTLLPQAQNKVQWDTYLDLMHQNGAPDEFMKGVPRWNEADPESSRAAAKKLGMTQKEQADVEHNKAMEPGAGGTAGRPLTETKRADLKAERDKQNRDTELWIRDPKNTEGIRISAQGQPFALNQLTDYGKDEYARRRLQTENDFRTQTGMPTLEDAARAASQSGDYAGYNKVAGIYNEVTKAKELGRPTLQQLIPPPPPNTPAGRKARADELRAQLQTTKDPTQRQAIYAELQRLQPQQP